ncbi:MAG: HAD family hydrolase [Myxococcota bacterium]
MSRPARALSFDLDGTLYRVRRLSVAWRLRHERGLLVALMAARERIRHEPPLLSEDALFERQLELVRPSFALSDAEARRRVRALLDAFPDALTKGHRPRPGVKSAIQAAVARGLRVAIVSDYRPATKLAELGLDDLPWSALIGCEELGALKPHPEAFLALAARLGVEPGDIVHVGDREELDVTGALAAGCRAWLFSAKKADKTRAEKVLSAFPLDAFQPLFPPTG